MGLHPQRTARRAAAELAKWGGEGAAQVSGTHAVGVHLKGPKANTMKNQRGPKRRPPPPPGLQGVPWGLLSGTSASEPLPGVELV